MSEPPHDKFAAVRAAMRQDWPLWQVQHIDITCDGCEAEPIVGGRYKCMVCEDIDLCGACMRALVAARIKMSREAAPLAAPAAHRQGGRPRRWVAKLHSRDLAEKWAALQTAVPCLHPSHKFHKVVDGPERAVAFLAGQQASSSCGNGGSSGRGLQGQDAAVAAGAAAAAQEGSSNSAAAAAAGGSGGSSSGGTGLDRFLSTFPPSAASCRDVAWIVVSHPEADKQQEQLQQPQQAAAGGDGSAPQQQPDSSGGSRSGSSGSSLEERVDAAVEEWERLVVAAASSGRRPAAADVDALAAKHRILKGKWMLFARSGAEADAAWAAVARVVCGGSGGEPQLQPQPQPWQQRGQARQAAHQQQQERGQQQQQQGPEQQQGRVQQRLCSSAKVSSAGPAADGSWVLCAYTDNYQDSEDVQRVCRGLQRALPPGLLQDRRLLYKPDIYTYLGIYSRNEWQLKPTVLEARLS